MRVTVDTSHDSHEDIKKVIRMLQNLVGDSQEIFTNQPVSSDLSPETPSPFANIFGDNTPSSQEATQEASSASVASETAEEAKTEEASLSTDDLFAELFSEEELKKMDVKKESEEEEESEEETKPAKKKHDIELY